MCSILLGLAFELEINAECRLFSLAIWRNLPLQCISYEGESPRNRGSISDKGKDLYIFQDGHIGSGAHTASYLMGNTGSFPEGKASWAWSWLSTLPPGAEVKKMWSYNFPSPYAIIECSGAV